MEESNCEKLDKLYELFDLIEDKVRSNKLLNYALSKPNQFLDILYFYPTFIASEIINHDLKIEWLFAWVVENKNLLINELPEYYYQILLPQICALLIQPVNKDKFFTSKYKEDFL